MIIVNKNSTFNLPNTADRVLQGNGKGFLEAGLPNIKGSFGSWTRSFSPADGSFYVQNTGAGAGGAGSGGSNMGYYFNASRSSSVYKDGITTVQPPACLTNFIIKY